MLTTTRAVAPGDPAPDFALSDGVGRTVTLRDLRGSAVILAFDGGAWDPSRADELAHFNALAARIPGANVELLGITRDGIWTDLALADDAMRVPILTDLDSQGSVAARFGVAGRAVIVLDEWGTVRWRHDGPAPRADDLLEALTALAPTPRDPASPRRLLESHDGDARDGEPVAFGISTRLGRREFVAATLAAAIAMAILPAAARAESAGKALTNGAPSIGAAAPVTLTVNGRAITLNIEPRVTLLDALREYAGLTATKKGCDHGQCGACTVHVNGRRQLSCLTLAVMHQGDAITTLEGLAQGDKLSPMQAAFIEHDGFQCGYCTPGQIMSATALLHEPCGPADADVRECMSGNICRCGAYPGIVAAIQDVRRQGRA